MRLIKLSMLNIMQYLTPVFTVLLAWGLLGKRITPWQFAGMAVVVPGIMLVSWRSRPGQPGCKADYILTQSRKDI